MRIIFFRILNVNTGSLARFADGSAVVKFANTSVLTTVVSKNNPTNNNASFTPLTVDYRQKSAAAGRIPTNHLRRDYGYMDKEILTSRIIDRSLRPLFPTGYSNETQIVCNLLAVDGEYDPTTICINAASAALSCSDVPWNGPVGAVQVSITSDDRIVINPTTKQLSDGRLNMIVACASKDRVVMIDASSDIVPSALFLQALTEGLHHTQSIIEGINSLCSEVGKKRRVLNVTGDDHVDGALVAEIESLASDDIKNVFTDYTHHKISRDQATDTIRKNLFNTLKASKPGLDMALFDYNFYKIAKRIFRDLILVNRRRLCDGRGPDDLRDITCKVNLYDPLHGSALFQRGQTQVFCTTTFDSPQSAARVDPITALISGVKEKNFFLHYEFPSFATNETGKHGFVGRRELGHGALAEKGLRPVLPSTYPFTVRLTAEVFESNGSSSMASVCCGCLALMDAGVPISESVSGVAMGLISGRAHSDDEEGDNNDVTDHVILTDLMGIEDYMGDMDFKLASTKNGVTALQMDTKLPGIPIGIITLAIKKGIDANQRIINIMEQTIDKPRQQKKNNHPTIETLVVAPNKRSKLLGVGGSNIKMIMARTGVDISSIDETSYQLFAPNGQALSEAKTIIEELLSDEGEPVLEFGAIYKVKIIELKEYGAMVQLHPSLPTVLIHNSQLDSKKVDHPSILGLEVGKEIQVKYFGRDPVSGRIRLSRKVLLSPITEIKKLM
ncbi:hypothetical protein HELRODRAFT_115530 [Helobdella robusta]|uniref:polyribonucleotide nucleotidyltransferase n=1 Tax=Helobdella robusta TaxID=6412 RepID=T1EG90_HELRO|nr:hypothetical protein HELRODRAFT_115530 [Helobdella robusta]ESN93677.1 hypothetical protein HELRODRAFT_115530 [Helobdella robusta]